MKKLIYTFAFILIIHCTLIIENCMCQWMQCNGPYSGTVYSLASNGNNIFAGTYNYGVYHSTDSGNNWCKLL